MAAREFSGCKGLMLNCQFARGGRVACLCLLTPPLIPGGGIDPDAPFLTQTGSNAISRSGLGYANLKGPAVICYFAPLARDSRSDCHKLARGTPSWSKRSLQGDSWEYFSTIAIRGFSASVRVLPRSAGKSGSISDTFSALFL